jgi:hypothetical protein
MGVSVERRMHTPVTTRYDRLVMTAVIAVVAVVAVVVLAWLRPPL